MSTKYTSLAICEMALRKIGSFSINDESANASEMMVTLDSLDLIMAELSGVERCWWLIPKTIQIPLILDVSDYDITTVLIDNDLLDGIQFPYDANLDNGEGVITEITMRTRARWDKLFSNNTSGTPSDIYINRHSSPTMQVYPIPGEGIDGSSINLSFQSFAPSVGSINNEAHGLREAWQRWAVFQLAADIGDGPVRKLPARDIQGFEKRAAIALTKLLSFENKEHESQPIKTAFRY